MRVIVRFDVATLLSGSPPVAHVHPVEHLVVEVEHQRDVHAVVAGSVEPQLHRPAVEVGPSVVARRITRSARASWSNVIPAYALTTITA